MVSACTTTFPSAGKRKPDSQPQSAASPAAPGLLLKGVDPLGGLGFGEVGVECLLRLLVGDVREGLLDLVQVVVRQVFERQKRVAGMLVHADQFVPLKLNCLGVAVLRVLEVR